MPGGTAPAALRDIDELDE